MERPDVVLVFVALAHHPVDGNALQKRAANSGSHERFGVRVIRGELGELTKNAKGAGIERIIEQRQFSPGADLSTCFGPRSPAVQGCSLGAKEEVTGR